MRDAPKAGAAACRGAAARGRRRTVAGGVVENLLLALALLPAQAVEAPRAAQPKAVGAQIDG